MERTAMRYLMLLASVCIVAGALGFVSRPRAEAPTDSFWVKAVALAGANDDLVPGLIKMHMQEVDKNGKPKNEDKYYEAWSTLSLGADGEVQYETVRVIENGEDITESEKAKEQAEDEDEEESESERMEAYNPFDPDSQDRISVVPIGSAGIVGGRNTVVYEFTERTEDDVEISGRAWLEIDSGAPVRIEYTPDPLPKRVKSLTTTVEYEHMYPDSLVARHMVVEVTGGFLFIKKHFHMDMTFDRHWRLPRDEKEDTGGQ
jgi:hypothetical protein